MARFIDSSYIQLFIRLLTVIYQGAIPEILHGPRGVKTAYPLFLDLPIGPTRIESCASFATEQPAVRGPG